MIRVGTAGFSYKDWEGPVYPEAKPRGFDPLAFMAGFFPCIEMNVTFYRPPTPENVAKWLRSVEASPDFRFAFKLYRGLTHAREDETLAPFLDAMAVCRDADRLGAILMQFPFFFENSQDNRRRLSRLASGLSGWPTVIEVRHNSWITDPALDFLRRLDLSICNIDICSTPTAIPPGSFATGPIGYVRLHGRNREAWFDKKATAAQKYDYLYGPAELSEWTAHVRRIAADAETTFVITNNHFAGKAVANAFQLARELCGTSAEPPEQLVRRYPDLAS
ncbi:MAG: DUF72 domain-containing protein [Planctomycetota bacterium]